MFFLLFLAGLWAGAQNALAGGGSFVTLPALVLAGLDPRAANITSTVALFPGQVTSGLAARSLVSGAQHLSFRALFAISLIGGALGAILLLATPVVAFARMVPWLVLFATGMSAWGSFALRPSSTVPLGPVPAGVIQFLIAIYGGYFGGGIGFLMLSALTVAGLPVRSAGATKSALAAVMNASAVAIFVFSPEVDWPQALCLSAGSILGGLGGAWMLYRVPELFLRFFVIAIGTILGGVDGFDEDEAESKGHNGAVVLGRLLAAERNSLEALELTDKLLDAGARPIERFRKECRPVLG